MSTDVLHLTSGSGLNTVNLSTLNTFQQVVLFFLTIVGSSIFVSAFVVLVRLRSFNQKFASVLDEEQANRSRSRARTSRLRRHSSSRESNDAEDATPGMARSPRATRGGLGSTGNVQEDQAAGLSSSSANVITSSFEETPYAPNEDGENEPAAEVVSQVSSSPADHRTNLSHVSPSADTAGADAAREDRIKFHPDTVFQSHYPESPRGRRPHRRIASMAGVGARPDSTIRSHSASRSSIRTPVAVQTSAGQEKRSPPFSGFISRNSQFYGLTEADRERLGGLEYRAVKFLAFTVPIYFFLWQLLGCLGIGAYVAHNRPKTALQNGLGPWWMGAFNAVSAFNNSGLSLLDANMVAFQTSYYMLFTMGLLILAGNTCYPVFLRLIVWTMWKLMPDTPPWQEHRQTLRFLLDHPRRCYTNLFPSRHTWWLLASVVCLNGIDWAAFEILNIGNPKINLPTFTKVVDGLFQALAVRSGGFYVVPIPSVRVSLQFLYVVMMYISAYPVVITMRNSNVYEERSLGIYTENPAEPVAHTDEFGAGGGFAGIIRRVTTGATQAPKSYFVRQQLRAQLAHDLWWITLAMFVILIIETGSFERDPVNYSVFNVIFEVVSAYGCVGISIGLPDQFYSYCGSWHVLSKLVLCAVMLRGRHRGLPVAIDKAVLLPRERVHQAEEEDGIIRLSRSMSRGLDQA